MAKSSIMFICNSCAYETARWLGQCPNCREWNSFEESSAGVLPLGVNSNTKLVVKKINEVEQEAIERATTGFEEFNRVLGGGLVKGEVILISGEPGVGKSTLLLQLLANVGDALYVSAEESLQQVALRGKRLNLNNVQGLNLLSAYEIGGIIDEVLRSKPKILVIDSIQTVYSEGVRGLPGGLAQIKSVSSQLIKFAKEQGIITFIVGQVTKEGVVAGPKLLEHLVDVVLELEGDSKMDYRVLRCIKNRFGPTTEIGIFEMQEGGMVEVANPSLYFVENSKEAKVGVCAGVIMEGNRSIIVELQALTARTFFPMPRRVADGFSKTRLEVLVAILAKYTKYDLQDKDVYLNIAGGLRYQDSMMDLAALLAIISSTINIALPHSLVAFGEVSLTGQIRLNKRSGLLEKECKRLGYKTFQSLYPQVNHISQLFLLFSKKNNK